MPEPPFGRRPILIAWTVALTVGLADHAAGQEGADAPRRADPGGPSRVAPTLPAVRVQGAAPVIDGRIDEAAWSRAPIAGDFVQFQPTEGGAPSQRTEVRLLYDDSALYVAFRAFDTSPDSIVGQLTRRDQSSYSDRVIIVVDSYFDRRTAFLFGVNPVGVKMDAYLYNDTEEDVGWDAVWDAATAVDSLGWTAEFRIPLSQLRFSSAERQDWGLNFAREIARLNELSVWSPLSRQEQAMVSRSGTLEGLEDLSPPIRVEVLPYLAARMTRAQGEASNPFYDPTALDGRIGADVKIGITNNFTLDLTANPDFGQVEADPGQVNLTAFETSFPERRPFFLEGAGIFNFGLGPSGGSLFYSRRIGRPPQGRVPGSPDWADVPDRTQILGAAKLSGKSEGGWSVGALGALTRSEIAAVDRAGEIEELEVEPRTLHSVLRVQRDFRAGGSALGAIATVTRRESGGADALGLRNEAYAGGIDFRHRFHDGTIEARGYLLGSHVAGTAEAILAGQRSSARYFQRPDASHVSVDPEASSLAGWAAITEVRKVGAGAWRYSVLTELRSPGFELNDLGFMTRTDLVSPKGFVGYQATTPGRRLREWRLNLNVESGWTFGREHTLLGGNVNGSLTTLGNLNAFGGFRMNGRTLDPGRLRSGPALRSDPSLGGWIGFNTDSRRTFGVNWRTEGGRRPSDGSWELSHSADLRGRPTEWATLSGRITHARRVEDGQWVGRVTAQGSPHYVLGRMDQTTLGITVRAEVALTPALSLQYYGQPFMSAGTFGSFKQVVSPREGRPGDRFGAVAAVADGDGYRADLNGDGVWETFPDPDFNVRQFRSNAVLRWEYRPGSTLFFVWAQARDHSAAGEPFRTGEGLGDLFSSKPEDVVMLKVTYWLAP